MPDRELDDDALWRGFQDRTLPAPAWTHRAHLRIAEMHVARYDLDEAHLRMRVGIIRLNAAHELVETPQRGYHETMTRVWLMLVADARARGVPAATLERELPLRYYSRERLFSVRARSTFVEPDLASLP